MTLKRSPARFAVLLAALTGTVLAAAPAYAADDVTVKVSGNSSFNVGAQQARTLTVTVDNNSNQTYLQVRRVLVFSVPGLRPEHVAVQRASGGPFGGGALVAQSIRDGVVAVVDSQTFALRRRDDVSAQYRVRFTTGAPAEEGVVLAIAQAREGFQDFQELARSGERGIELRGGQRATPTAQPTTPGPLSPAPNTEAGAAPPGGSAAAQNPLTNPTSAQDDEAAFGWPLYLIGALLVGGGGVTLWLIFRRRDDEEEVPDQADAAAAWSPSHRRPAPQARTYGTPVAGPQPGAGYAAGPANPPPRTMVMPPVPDQHQPPPPVDPWPGR